MSFFQMAHKTIHTHIRVQAAAKSGIRISAMESVQLCLRPFYCVKKTWNLFERRNAEYPKVDTLKVGHMKLIHFFSDCAVLGLSWHLGF